MRPAFVTRWWWLGGVGGGSIQLIFLLWILLAYKIVVSSSRVGGVVAGGKAPSVKREKQNIFKVVFHVDGIHNIELKIFYFFPRWHTIVCTSMHTCVQVTLGIEWIFPGSCVLISRATSADFPMPYFRVSSYKHLSSVFHSVLIYYWIIFGHFYELKWFNFNLNLLSAQKLASFSWWGELCKWLISFDIWP